MVAKYSLQYAEPVGLLTLRFGIAAVLLIACRLILSRRRGYRLSKADIWHSVVAGILMQAVYLGGVFTGISLGIGAGLSALIVGLQPLLTAALAAVWLAEHLTWRKSAGILLGLLGVTLVMFERGNLDGALSATGIGLSVLALTGITLGAVYQKKYCSNIPPLDGLAVQFSAASLVLLPIALSIESFQFDWQWNLIAALAWLVLMLSLGAVFLLYWLIRRGEASRVATLFYLVPPVVAIQAWLVFDEKISFLLLLGTGICIAGVAIVMTAPKNANSTSR